MAKIVRVDSMADVVLSNRWRDSATFKAYGRFIAKDGSYVSEDYPGAKFKVTYKKERAFTGCERFQRFVQGIFLSVLTLGLCNLYKENRQLFYSKIKVMRIAVRVEDNLYKAAQRKNTVEQETKPSMLDSDRACDE